MLGSLPRKWVMRELQQQLLAVAAAVVSLGQAKFSNG